MTQVVENQTTIQSRPRRPLVYSLFAWYKIWIFGQFNFAAYEELISINYSNIPILIVGYNYKYDIHQTFLSSWRERQFATVKKTCKIVKTWFMIATTNINQVQEVEYYTFNHVLNYSSWVVFCKVCVAQSWV